MRETVWRTMGGGSSSFVTTGEWLKFITLEKGKVVQFKTIACRYFKSVFLSKICDVLQ